MRNKNQDVKTLILNIEAVKAAASNANRIQDVALEVPIVDPRDLSCEDQIFGITLQPIKKGTKVTPDTAVHTAIQPIVVETLSNKAKPGCITVNGIYDLPKENGRVTGLDNCYFTDLETAKQVCEVITEVELERSLQRQIDEKANSDFYEEQLKNRRF
jgi:hypothetical protein